MATVTIDAGRWQRVLDAAVWAERYTRKNITDDDLEFRSGDLDTVAPVAPDPGLREAIQTAIFNSLTITYDIAMDCDLVSCDPETAATAVLDVLAERGVV